MSQDLGYESLPKLFNKDGTSPTNNSPPKNAPTFGDVVRMRNATGARRKKKKKSAAVVDYSSVCSSGSEWDSCHNRDRTRNINGFADGGIMIAERNNVAVDNAGVFTETSGRSSVASDSNYSSPESQLWDKVMIIIILYTKVVGCLSVCAVTFREGVHYSFPRQLFVDPVIIQRIFNLIGSHHFVAFKKFFFAKIKI